MLRRYWPRSVQASVLSRMYQPGQILPAGIDVIGLHPSPPPPSPCSLPTSTLAYAQCFASVKTFQQW
eukprot:3101775-Pleurochrysis_carterae.AAC.1